MRPLPNAPKFRLSLPILLGAAAAAAAQPSAPGDATRGRQIFVQNCAVCHATGLHLQPDGGQAPLLAGVVGRHAAARPDFSYSPALRESGLTWDAATLDRFLSGPSVMVPGTNMAVVVSAPADRLDLIAFLATLKPVATPPPAPLNHPRTAGDWQNDAPGVHHQVRLADLPPPFATRSAGNGPIVVDRPLGAALAVPAGFQVKLFASGLTGPRLLRTAPNGDIFIAETGAGRIRVLRAADGAEEPRADTIFAGGLRGPFGLAFYPNTGEPRWLYVGLLNSVVRYPYRTGDLVARGPAETVIPELASSTGGHTTRDVAFSLDGRRLFVSVGSGSNVAEGMTVKTPAEVRAWEATHPRGSTWGYEAHRADVLVADPEGRGLKIYACGIRNAVGLAVQPATGELWVSTNERDALGDDLVPDYVTHVQAGGFYGWPWYYLGNHEDPRRAGERPDLAGAAIVPDVLVQAHSAMLEMTFYPRDAKGPAAFPAEYRGDIFAAAHGSWNRAGRTGSKVIRIHLHDGVPVGGYEDFLTGFVIDDHHVWGRPVGVTVAHDGALLVTDDANGTLWRISYTGSQSARFQ